MRLRLPLITKENIALGIFLAFIVGAGIHYSSVQTVPQNVADTNPVVVHREAQRAITNPSTAPLKETGNILGSKITDNGTITTYENLDWNFSVRYPSSYVIQENKESRTFDMAVTKYHNWDYYKGPPPPSLSVSAIKQKESKIFTDPVLYTKKMYSLPPYGENDPSDTITVKPIVVNGVSGAEMLRSEETEEGHVDSRTLIFIKNSFVYQISYFPSNDADYNKIADSFTIVK